MNKTTLVTKIQFPKKGGIVLDYTETRQEGQKNDEIGRQLKSPINPSKAIYDIADELAIHVAKMFHMIGLDVKESNASKEVLNRIEVIELNMKPESCKIKATITTVEDGSSDIVTPGIEYQDGAYPHGGDVRDTVDRLSLKAMKYISDIDDVEQVEMKFDEEEEELRSHQLEEEPI